MLTKRIIACIGITGLVVFGMVAFRFSRESADVDACLDHGGSFDYAAMRCDSETSHTFIAYGSRHPHDGYAALLALAVAAGSTAMYTRKSC